MKYKRFMVAGYYQNYPSGFLDDVVGSFDTLQEAIDFADGDMLDITIYGKFTYEYVGIFDRIEGVSYIPNTASSLFLYNSLLVLCCKFSFCN